jgi:cytochrome P450
MLAGAPGTAAAAAAASVLALEGGTQALAWGVPFYAACVVMSLLVDAVRARLVFRGKLPTVPWRPNLMFNVYQKPKRNLLDRVSRRMAMDNGSDVDAKTKNHSHRAFATVVGNCPFAHVGGGDLARVALNQQPVKSPLYRAFESFAGVGIFTAEGEDWAAKRSEVLGAFASAGLEPLAAASKRSASKLTAEIDAQLAAEKDVEKGATGRADGDGVEVDMLPRLQRATLRATFEYLAGVDLETAASVDRRSVSEWEDEYLTAATDLRHLIPARARSVWMLSDWAYAASPVGRIERRRIKEARRLPELALRTARPGSPLDDLRRGSAHAAEWGTRHAWWSRLRRTAGVGRDALLDEATTLLFAGHDTQSATLSWALLRLASDVKTQGTLRASLTRDPHVVTGLGLQDVVCVGATGVSRVGERGERGETSGVANERTSPGARGGAPRNLTAPPGGAVRGAEARAGRGTWRW